MPWAPLLGLTGCIVMLGWLEEVALLLQIEWSDQEAGQSMNVWLPLEMLDDLFFRLELIA